MTPGLFVFPNNSREGLSSSKRAGWGPSFSSKRPADDRNSGGPRGWPLCETRSSRPRFLICGAFGDTSRRCGVRRIRSRRVPERSVLVWHNRIFSWSDNTRQFATSAGAAAFFSTPSALRRQGRGRSILRSRIDAGKYAFTGHPAALRSATHVGWHALRYSEGRAEAPETSPFDTSRTRKHHGLHANCSSRDRQKRWLRDNFAVPPAAWTRVCR